MSSIETVGEMIRRAQSLGEFTPKERKRITLLQQKNHDFRQNNGRPDNPAVDLEVAEKEVLLERLHSKSYL